MENTFKKSLKERAIEIASGCELMIGRDKGEMDKLMNSIVSINDFDFLTDSEKGVEYVVFTIMEDDAHFFFGGSVLTDKCKQLRDEGYLEEVQKEGLPTMFGKKQPKDKKKQAYTTVQFYPSETASK
jgi:hypothetical protein